MFSNQDPLAFSSLNRVPEEASLLQIWQSVLRIYQLLKGSLLCYTTQKASVVMGTHKKDCEDF